MNEFKGLAQESIYQQTPFQRALGRMVSIPNVLPEDTPAGVAEADLAADAFWTYFGEPAQRDPLPAGRDLNRRLIEWATGAQSWEASKAKTSGRLLTAASAAGILAGQLIGDPEIKKLLDAQKEAEEAAKEEAAAQAAQDALEQMGEANDPGIQAAKAEAQAKAAAARAKAAAAAATIEAGMDKLENGAVGQAKRASALKQAKAGAEQAEAFASGWGIDPGSVQAGDLTAIQTLQQKYGAALEAITKLMGRVQGIALSQQAKRVQKAFIVVQDGYTQKLPNIFPGELSLLNPGAPALIRAAKMGEYADHGLVGMVEGSDAKTEGGIVFLVDGSGSMGDYERDTKATALALGMAQAAETNGQPFHLIRFSSASDPLLEVDSEQPAAERMAWAAKSQGGGTDFNLPMTRAMDYIETLGERADQTDIVMITDGQADLGRATAARFRDFADRHHTRLTYLAVGPRTDMHDGLPALASERLWLGDGQGLEETAQALAGFLWKEDGQGRS